MEHPVNRDRDGTQRESSKGKTSYNQMLDDAGIKDAVGNCFMIAAERD